MNSRCRFISETRVSTCLINSNNNKNVTRIYIQIDTKYVHTYIVIELGIVGNIHMRKVITFKCFFLEVS